jgi:lipopolysaccharide biosynthesis protein
MPDAQRAGVAEPRAGDGAGRRNGRASRGLRALAFYLPQFHPIPENDRWWGAGFTEWRNVARARPQFRGHYQPHLPGELGFYDLRLPEIQERQAELAREHGVHGFVYYHYWFEGRRLLHRPVDQLLARGEPDLPFCLCWANENWTRIWDGRDRHVLVEQGYSRDDDLHHIRWLAAVFADPRYLRVNGRPVFLVYRAGRIPGVARTLETWRAEALRLGLGELYLCKVESGHLERGRAPGEDGFDAAVDFQPDWQALGTPIRRGRPAWRALTRLGLSERGYQHHNVFDYADVVRRMLERPPVPYPRFPGVTPMWDNTARRATDATILRGSTPELYRGWLSAAADAFTPFSPEENLIFINGWNEWAEGNHLEPCERWGRAYLEATRDALAAYTEKSAGASGSWDEGTDLAPHPSDPPVPVPQPRTAHSGSPSAIESAFQPESS